MSTTLPQLFENAPATLQLIRWSARVLQVKFIGENGGGPGVRLRKSPKQKRASRARPGSAVSTGT